jgi:hypothetical protein
VTVVRRTEGVGKDRSLIRVWSVRDIIRYDTI